MVAFSSSRITVEMMGIDRIIMSARVLVVLGFAGKMYQEMTEESYMTGGFIF